MRGRHVYLCERIDIQKSDIDDDLAILSADINAQHVQEIELRTNNILALIAANEVAKTKSSEAAAIALLSEWAMEESGKTEYNGKKQKKEDSQGSQARNTNRRGSYASSKCNNDAN